MNDLHKVCYSLVHTSFHNEFEVWDKDFHVSRVHLQESNNTQVLVPFLPNIAEGLVAVATQFSSDVLSLCLETLSIVLSVSYYNGINKQLVCCCFFGILKLPRKTQYPNRVLAFQNISFKNLDEKTLLYRYLELKEKYPNTTVFFK